MTTAEVADLLKRLRPVDLVKLLAIQAASRAAKGDDSSLSMACEGTVGIGPTMMVRVRITKQRRARARKGAA